MTWKDWLREGRIEEHKPAREEVAAQRRAASHSLNDAALSNLSPESRFQLAYDAALNLATIAVLASGYRLKARFGHHQLTFEAAEVALGKSAGRAIAYLDLCRRQRNAISYEGQEIGETVANELLQETARFEGIVDKWLKTNRPDLV